ncbi:prolipoprotein diacylglyceryl transferase family protein [Elusimicrobiota bacterium]
MLGIFFVIMIATLEARRHGYEAGTAAKAMILVVFLALVGSKFYEIITIPGRAQLYLSNPMQFLFYWEAPKTWVGISLSVMPALFIPRIYKLPFRKSLDAVGAALALGQAVFKFGCFTNGCCYGIPSKLPWAVIFNTHTQAFRRFGEIPIHPTQIYESISALIVFSILWAWRKKKRFDGEIFLLFLALFPISRFFLQFLRHVRPVIEDSGLDKVQLSALVSVFLALTILLSMRFLLPPREAPSQDQGSRAPDPALVYPKANPLKRALAFLIDMMIAAGLLGINMLPAVLYILFKDSLINGASIGKRLLGLKVVKIQSKKKKCDWGTSVFRNFLLSIPLINLIYCIPAVITGAVDKNGRHFSDKLALTQVVEV